MVKLIVSHCHMLKLQKKVREKHWVTKLMRLHYHLGFYVYVTLHFMVIQKLLIGSRSLSLGQLSSESW